MNESEDIPCVLEVVDGVIRPIDTNTSMVDYIKQWQKDQGIPDGTAISILRRVDMLWLTRMAETGRKHLLKEIEAKEKAKASGHTEGTAASLFDKES